MRDRPLFEQLSTLISAIGDSSFPRMFARVVNSVAPSDSTIIFLYGRHSPPEILFERSAHPLRRNSLANYVEGFYLLDPFYRAAVSENKRGIIRIESIEPPGFRDSEYFCHYYKHAYAEDELNIIFRVSPGAIFAASIERAEGKGRYLPHEVSALSALEAPLRSATEAHWRWSASAQLEGADEKAAHFRFMQVINEFGRKSLTAREYQIVQLILRGFSTVEIARLNKISEETVKVHRRNIYEKLKISSLSELFGQIINNLGVSSPKR